ncbi:hypothetical protein PSP6_510011 [Paraburkholderia tropica]|nr:hypothetical protein PSP6_510011 [Paraburkholderia tropica]
MNGLFAVAALADGDAVVIDSSANDCDLDCLETWRFTHHFSKLSRPRSLEVRLAPDRSRFTVELAAPLA